MNGIGYSELSTKVQKILSHDMMEKLKEIAEAYDLPEEELEYLMLSLFVKDTSKVLWKGTKTKFVKVYDKELNRIVSENILNDRQLGTLLRLSQYIRYEDNILRNSDDTYMSQKDMKEHLNVSKSTVNELLKVLKANNMIFTATNPENRSKTIYYLTPELFYRGQFIHQKIKNSLIELTEYIKKEIKSKKIKDIEDKIVFMDNLFVQVMIDEFIVNVVGKAA
jgi:DNA-binding MarR family transcriptional regulator